MSSLNKVADVVPELLIGAAVDVVVRGADSLVGDVLGVESRYAQLAWLAAINVVVWIVESRQRVRRRRAVARPGPGRRARPAGGGVRPRAAPRPRLARGARRRARRWRPSTTTSTSSSGSSTWAPRRSCRPRSTWSLVGAVFAVASWQLLRPRLPPDPGDHRRLAALPAPARAALRPGPRGRRPTCPARCSRQPRRHRDDQGVHRRGPRARAGRGGLARLPRGQRRRDPLVGRVRAAGPDGDPRRLHLHPAARRLGDASTATSRSASTRCWSS